MRYMNRPLSRSIMETSQKIVIVEGARAVGKTSLARHELEPLGFSYHTLADKTTYEIAKDDPTHWLRTIGHPAIIDEAQRIEGLTLALKEYVDAQDDPGVYFVLTGSASIGKAGLDGQDPLTRRSQRYTLSPLTQREIMGNGANLVDDLWGGMVNTRYANNLSEAQLGAQLRIGGFPYYVSASASARQANFSSQVRSDLQNVLGDTLLPEERFDRVVAYAALKRLLSLPGDILNMSSIGKEIGCDNRTVERYVSIFLSRFLIRSLPNLNQLPQKQLFTRSKIHPIDTSFSFETLKEGGSDPLGDRALLGKLLESYVVSQIVPDAQWANHRADSYYWRESGRSPKEVDLVLLCDNELVGVEVKAATSVSKNDLTGLWALAKDPRFRRGYLVYLGDRIVSFSDKICAIPVSALWDGDAFVSVKKQEGDHVVKRLEEKKEDTSTEETAALVDANLFLSYCHADNEHLNNAMVMFAEAIADEYEFQFGSKLSLFVDRKSLRWGDDWRAVIERNIEETNFMMPCVTPRYLQSAACREEFLQFVGRVEEGGPCRVMSLLWVPVKDGGTDQVLSAVNKHQFKDVSSVRYLGAQDVEYQRIVQELAEEMHRAIEENETKLLRGEGPIKSAPGSDREGDQGLAEKMDIIADRMPEFNEAMEVLKSEVGKLTASMAGLESPAAGGFSKWAVTLAAKTKPSLDRMNAALDVVNVGWTDCYELMSDYITLSRSTEKGADAILPSLYALKTATSKTFDAQQIDGIVRSMPMLSARLKPLANGLRRLLDTYKDVSEMTDVLIQEAEAVAADSTDDRRY